VLVLDSAAFWDERIPSTGRRGPELMLSRREPMITLFVWRTETTGQPPKWRNAQ